MNAEDNTTIGRMTEYMDTLNDTCEKSTTQLVIDGFVKWAKLFEWQTAHESLNVTKHAHTNFLCAVYDSGSYSSADQAEQAGGLYAAGDVFFGITAMLDAASMFRATSECADANSDLVFVFRVVP
jgi:hypothetical protein